MNSQNEARLVVRLCFGSRRLSAFNHNEERQSATKLHQCALHIPSSFLRGPMDLERRNCSGGGNYVGQSSKPRDGPHGDMRQAAGSNGIIRGPFVQVVFPRLALFESCYTSYYYSPASCWKLKYGEAHALQRPNMPPCCNRRLHLRLRLCCLRDQHRSTGVL